MKLTTMQHKSLLLYECRPVEKKEKINLTSQKELTRMNRHRYSMSVGDNIINSGLSLAVL